METDPINPSPSDSSPSMEINSTDPIASGSPAPDPSAEQSSVADSAATESSEPVQAETPAPEPEPVRPATPITPDPPTDQESAVSSIPVPAASDAIAERIQVAATTSSSTDENSSKGGEWDLLSAKVQQWWDDNNLVDLWQRSRRPLFLLAALIGLTLLIRIYSGILAAIASIPLAPRLFELVGLGWVIWFSVTRLIRSEERKALLANVGGIWSAFRGSVRP
jgi:hypothetical protein